MSVTKRFVATSVGSAVVSAPYIRRRGFGTTAVQGQSLMRGSVSNLKSFTADSVGKGVFSATMSPLKGFVAESIGDGVVTGTVSLIKSFGNAAIGQASVTGTQSILKGFVGTATGIAQGDWDGDDFQAPDFQGALIRVKKRIGGDAIGQASPTVVYLRIRSFEPATALGQATPDATIKMLKGFVGEPVGETILDATQSVTKTFKPLVIGEADGSASELAVKKRLRVASEGQVILDIDPSNTKRFGETKIIARADFDIDISPLEKLTVELKDIIVLDATLKDG